MLENIFVSVLFVAVAFFPILAAIFNWDFFFNHRKARLFVSLLGRTGARIFYAILGISLLFYGATSIL